MSEAPAGDVRWCLRELGQADVGAVQELMQASADYFETCFGLPPAPGEAASEFAALPPGASREQKRFFGIEDAETGELLGVLDEVEGWPQARTLTLGLVLLRPGARGRGLASAVLDAREEAWRGQGMRSVRAGVVARNDGSLRFFERRGFVRVQLVTRDDAAPPYEIVVLEREL